MTKKRLYVLFAFLFAVVFALVCAFTVTACNSKDDKSETTPDDTTEVVPGGDENPGGEGGEEETDAYIVRITTEKTAYTEGDTETLTATVYLGDAATSEKVTWSVEAEPEGCVTIDDGGLLTAVSEGKATITAAFAYDDGKTAKDTLDITVSAKEGSSDPGKADVYAVTMETDTATLTVGDEITLSAYVSVNGDKDENLSVEWSANPAGLVEIEESTLKAVGAGTVTVTASYKYGETEDEVASASISIVISEAASTHTHSYSEPAWTWTGDDTDGYTAATATFTCTAEGNDCTWTDKTYTISYTLTSADVATEAATCVAAGKITYTAVVTLDKEYTDTKEVTIPATGEHTCTVDETTQWTWTETEGEYTCTATVKCSVCQNDVTIEANVESADTAPTCTAAGYTTYTATYGSGTVDTKIVTGAAATGHTCTVETNTGWTWVETDNGYACTATVACSVCSEEVELDADVTSEPVAATCGEAGYTTYTATYNGQTVSIQTIEGDPATGEHQYTAEGATWSWEESENGYACTATVTCTVCGHDVNLNADVAIETHEATCAEAGHTDYTATYNGQSVGGTKTVQGAAATGVHTYTETSEVAWDWTWRNDETKGLILVATATVKCDVCNGSTYTAEGTVGGLDADEKYTATLTIPAASNAAGADATYTDTCYENYAINITGASNVLAGERYTLYATVTLDGSTYEAFESVDEEIAVTWAITEGGDYAVIEADTGILTAEAVGDIKVTATFITKDNRTINSEVEISIGKNPAPKIAELDFDYADTYSFITTINSGETESGPITAGRALTNGILTLQTRSSGTMTVGHNTSTDRYGLKTNAASDANGGYIKIDLSDYLGQTVTISADMSCYSTTSSASLILATDIATSTAASSVLRYVDSTSSSSVSTLSSDSILVTADNATVYVTWTGYIYLYSVVVRVADSAEADTYTVKIDSTEETIAVGDDVSLGATVYMNGIAYGNLTVVWSWETVDGGAVELDENTGYLKGVTEGTVIITATYTPAGGTAVYDTMTIEVVAAAMAATNLVHIDFTDAETSTSWLGVETPALDSYKTVSEDKTDPSGYVTVKACSTSGADLRYTYAQNVYGGNAAYYSEDYYALRIGNYNTNNTNGSYIEINIGGLVGKTVSVTVEAAWATGSTMPTLVLATSLGTATAGGTVLASLTSFAASDRTPQTLSWNGEIESDWTTLYLNTVGYSVYILSVDVTVYESAETEEVSVVHLDFSDSSTYSWIGTPNETPSDTSSNYTTITETKNSESEPITLHVDSSNQPRLGYLDNSAGYNVYTDNYVAIRIGTTSASSVGSYFEIDVGNYKGQTVTITVYGSAASGNATDLILSTDTSSNTSGDSVLAYKSLTGYDRTPMEITWTGVVDDSWTKLYVKAVTHQTYILSIDMTVSVSVSAAGETSLAHLDLSDPDTYGWLGVETPTESGSGGEKAILSSGTTSVTDGGILSVTHASGSDYPTLRLVDNTDYSAEDFYAIYLKGYANSVSTAGNYIGIDVSQLVGQTVTITVDVAWYSGSGVYLVLASSLVKASSGTGVVDSLALDASTREIKTLTWTGTIEDGWSTLYLYGYSSAVYILSVDITAEG